MNKLISLFSTLSLVSCSLFGIQGVEEAPFQILQDHGDIQIRQYKPIIVAETTVQGSYEEASKQGFYRLFDYISGKNTGQQKIVMTAPVMQQTDTGEPENITMTAPVFQQVSTDGWQMAFVLPEHYTMETAPKPTDPTITIKQIPGKKVAVLTYSGILSETVIQEKINDLSSWLTKNKYNVISSARSAGFDPPWTLPFLRRNEIHIDIE